MCVLMPTIQLFIFVTNTLEALSQDKKHFVVVAI